MHAESATGPRSVQTDVIGNAVKVMRFTTGEEEEEPDDDGKDPAATALGAKGGNQRADALLAGISGKGLLYGGSSSA